MELIYRILSAAHANGTHHKLALAGVAQLSGPQAEAWRRMFLGHAEPLLTGSKAPDKEFKDFANHCLHPAETPGGADWGGAPEAAAKWFGETTQALRRGAWEEAAYAAGVLSHYYTDPLMPFHTGGSEAESVIHRAAEWSISKSFERLWRDAPAPEIPPLEGGEAGVAEMVRAAAAESHRHYQTLIDHYDFDVGVKQPEQGYDAEADAVIAALLAQAAAGFARLLDGAVRASGAEAPKTDLTARTIVAGLKIPVRWVLAKLEDAADRAEVERIHREFAATGRVVESLPEEINVVRAQKARDLGQAPERGAAAEIEALRGAISGAISGAPQMRRDDEDGARRRRVRLTRDDAVDRAPSIGPKTAARLAPLGVKTVGDLLDADPKAIANGLGDRRINARDVAQWRDQARLLTRTPGLKAAHAVMLVASGYRELDAIAAASPALLQEQMAAAASTDDVKRALRGAEGPDLEAARAIVESAQRSAEAA